MLLDLSFALGKTLDELRGISEADLMMYAQYMAEHGGPMARLEYLLAQNSATQWAVAGAKDLKISDFLPPTSSKPRVDETPEEDMAAFFA